MEHVLRGSYYALIERDGSTLSDILRLCSDKAFRKSVIWASAMRWRARSGAMSSSNMLIGSARRLSPLPEQARWVAYRSTPLPRAGRADSADQFSACYGRGRCADRQSGQGRLGTNNADTLGSMAVATIAMAELSRAESTADSRLPFSLFVDEFQAFTTLAFAAMMPNLRKYGVALTLANQYLFQLDEEVRRSILSSAGTLVSFRLAPMMQSVCQERFQLTFGIPDLLNLPNRPFYVRLMIDGTPNRHSVVNCVTQNNRRLRQLKARIRYFARNKSSKMNEKVRRSRILLMDSGRHRL